MGKEEIISYVMETPGNTNPNVLRSLLDGEASSNKFIVTITPTAEDFSGTMDKTSEEITAAHEAGQEIVFNVVGFPGFDHVYIPAAWYTYATDVPRCAACATLVDVISNTQIIIITSDAYGASSYYTELYPLTSTSGVLVVHDVEDTLDKTWQEIHDAFLTRGVIVVVDEERQNAVIGVEEGKGEYFVTVAKTMNWNHDPYRADSADGYPALEDV